VEARSSIQPKSRSSEKAQHVAKAAPSGRAIAEMFDTVSLGTPEDAIGFVAWRITHRFQREVERAIRHLDLTHLQFTVLALVAWMSREERPVVAADLARLATSTRCRSRTSFVLSKANDSCGAALAAGR